jgi:hypothetical protein
VNSRTKPGPAAQRERLALACELDRLNLRLAMRPTALERLSMAVMVTVAPIVPHLPGRIGAWARGIVRGTKALRGVYDYMLN